LDRAEAAEYVSRSTVQFDREVALGIWPKPLRDDDIAAILGIPAYTCRRICWDRKALDRRIDQITGTSHALASAGSELDGEI
jgi:hypothetical protein